MNTNIQDNSNSQIRSNHDLSFNWLGSADFGLLVPFHWQEMMPTDKITKCAPKIEMQMLPLASPTFGKMNLYVHYFFVPTRLIWQNSPDFFSQTGINSSATPPYILASELRTWFKKFGTTWSQSGRPVFNHLTSFGLPPFFNIDNSGIASDKISSLPFRAYQQVYWDFYRDPELLADSSKDKFVRTGSGKDTLYDIDNSNASLNYIPRVRSLTDCWLADLFATNGTSPAQYAGLTKTPNADSINSTSNTAERLRQIEALTRMAERLSLSGKRQIDRLYAKYGVKPEWNKLNMCQYVGGAKSSVLVSDITASADTSVMSDGTNTGAPLGAKAGAGYAAFNNLNIKFTAQEHGYLIGVFSVVPKLHYPQGMSKRFSRNQLYDFFTKELEHVGQVAVARKEVACNGWVKNYPTSADSETFAFTQPYYDYKYNPDVLAGDFAFMHETDLTEKDIHYMNAMGMYIDYPLNRQYNADNMAIQSNQLNQIFFYQGNEYWGDNDAHFHLNIDVDCVANRPMDGYAVPTIETTENPHQSSSPVHSETIL